MANSEQARTSGSRQEPMTPGVGGGGGGEGDSHIKRTGELVVPFRGQKSTFGTSYGVRAQKVHRSQKIMTGDI